MKFVLFVTLIWSILYSGWSITDEEYIQFKTGLAQIQDLTKEVKDLRDENQAGRIQVQVLTNEVQELRSENKQLRRVQSEQQTTIKRLSTRTSQLEQMCGRGNEPIIDEGHMTGMVQNTTIEERVTILELQMAEVQEDMLAVQERVTGVEGDVDFLFDEQVIQDERIYDLEQDAEDLDERVEVLESSRGGGGNVTALEERVETLEGTAAEHEADIEDLESATSNLDGRVETLEGETSELETRLTAAETQIEDLQATDVEFEERISDLEEGGGGTSNGTTIAFRAVMADDDDSNIPVGSAVIFSDVQLNEGNGYDAATGVFTVPSGGEGYYYFATYFTVRPLEYAGIDLSVNGVTVCTMYIDNYSYDSSNTNGGCNSVLFLLEGDEVQNVYWYGTDSTPVLESTSGVYNGFTGFRI